MGSTLIWWLLGGAVVVGGAAVWYVTKDGTKKPVAEVCLKDLPADMFAKVKIALDSKNVAALNAYAIESRGKGWLCAAGELEAASAAASKAGGGSGMKTGPQPGDLALDPIAPKPDVPGYEEPLEKSGAELFTTRATSAFAPTLPDCIAAFDALTLSDQTAVRSALNAYHNGDATYPKGTTSYLQEIADDFRARGENEFGNCLRMQAGLPLRFPEVVPGGGGGWADGGG